MKKEDVECPYKDRCSDFPNKCDDCVHNTGKKSYYEKKKEYPWQPYPIAPSPYKPPTWPPCKPYYWILATDNTGARTSNKIYKKLTNSK